MRLFSSGLLSKWGLSDGDAPEEWLDYCDDNGLPYGGWHSILRELVKRYLLPALDQEVAIVCIGTNHNPVRARTVNSADAERFWYGDHEEDEPRLTPEFIEIPMAEVAQIAAELARRDAVAMSAEEAQP